MRSAVAGLVVAVTLLAGCGGTNTTAGKPGASPSAAQLIDSPANGGGGAPQQQQQQQQQQQRSTNPFWSLISDTRRAAGKDTGTQTELLRDRLSRLSPARILEFEGWWRSLDRRLYTWDVWGAAYVIEDGCSDDCFRDFRAYVILLGQDAFKRAAKSPDSLAGVVSDAETGDWEGADDVAPDAYSTATGNDFPADTSDLSGNPRGAPWDDSQVGALIRRYPRLASQFR
jgi:uncharacterized protein DUF4240